MSIEHIVGLLIEERDRLEAAISALQSPSSAPEGIDEDPTMPDWVKPKAPAKKKQTVGEGDYAATRAFDKDQAGFVARNKAKIPAMGKEAEKALDGPEGDSLRDAEATAAARSRDTF